MYTSTCTHDTHNMIIDQRAAVPITCMMMMMIVLYILESSATSGRQRRGPAPTISSEGFTVRWWWKVLSLGLGGLCCGGVCWSYGYFRLSHSGADSIALRGREGGVRVGGLRARHLRAVRGSME